MISAIVVGRRGKGSSGGSTDPLIQSFLNGDYDGAPVEMYSTANGWPHWELDDTLLGTWTVVNASSVSGTECTLTLVSNDAVAELDIGEPNADYKYVVIGKDLPKPVVLAVGESGDSWARVILDTATFYGGDMVTLGTIHIVAASALTHYEVGLTPSANIITESTVYQALPQAKDVTNADVEIMGREVVPTYVAETGAGADGSVDTTPSRSNRLGTFEPIDVTAGAYPKTEHIEVSDDDGIEGVSDDVTVLLANATITPTLKDSGTETSSGAAFNTSNFSVAAGSYILAWSVSQDGTYHIGAAPTKAGLTFTSIGSVEQISNARIIGCWLAPCPAGFTNESIHFGASQASGVHWAVLELAPSRAATISAVDANKVSLVRWDNSVTTSFEIPYNQDFSDVHNLAIACLHWNNGVVPSVPRDGWTTRAEEPPDGSSLDVTGFYDGPPDTAASATWASNVAYAFGLALELQAV